MERIGHIINPVIVDSTSDLFAAQPITFESMKIAQEFAASWVRVRLYAAQFPEDRGFVPDGFAPTRDLNRSILSVGRFKTERRLPLIKDILDRLYEVSDGEYLIYSNVDIALMPHFYVTVSSLIDAGYDAMVINRRTIPKDFSRIDELPLMWAELGCDHDGYDCFVFKREVYPEYDLGTACIGANRIGRVLYSNVRFHAKQFEEVKTSHLTFHIGNEKTWLAERFRDYDLYNEKQLFRILQKMKAENNQAETPWLEEFYRDSLERICRLTTALFPDVKSQPKYKSILLSLGKRLGRSREN